MPRKRKAARAYRGPEHLTDAMEEDLLYGMVILNHNQSEEFKDEAAMLAAWIRHKDRLMHAWNLAGRRPWAYYKFTLRLKEPPVTWHEELEALQRLKLLTPEEITRLEHEQRELGIIDPAVIDNTHYMRLTGAHGFSTFMLEDLKRQNAVIAAWHERRGRPEVAAKFAERARIVTRLIAELAGDKV
jgi:hypothetical protein